MVVQNLFGGIGWTPKPTFPPWGCRSYNVPLSATFRLEGASSATTLPATAPPRIARSEGYRSASASPTVRPAAAPRRHHDQMRCPSVQDGEQQRSLTQKGSSSRGVGHPDWDEEKPLVLQAIGFIEPAPLV